LAAMAVTAGVFLVGMYALSAAPAHAEIAECDIEDGITCIETPTSGGGTAGSGSSGADGSTADSGDSPQSNDDSTNDDSTNGDDDTGWEEPVIRKPPNPVVPPDSPKPIDWGLKLAFCDHLSFRMKMSAYDIDDLKVRLDALKTQHDLASDPDKLASIRATRQAGFHSG